MQVDAPCERNRIAIALPMPVNPPVMQITCGLVSWSKKGCKGMFRLETLRVARDCWVRCAIAWNSDGPCFFTSPV